MSTYSLYQVDAFTTRPLDGNPCAVIFDCADLNDDAMLAIAREMNLSETSFVWRMDDGRFRARYFTPAEEIPLAGHPTIATLYALVDSGRLKLEGDYLKLPLVLRDGPVEVEIFAKSGTVERVVMSQRKPEFLRTYRPADVLPAFCLAESDLLPGAIIQTVSTGTPQLMIVLKDHASLRKATLDVEKYAALRNASDFFSPHLFCLQGVKNGATFARDFGLPPDTLEDPFTGSATGGMAAYLWHYGLIESPTFIAEQGHWMARPGEGYVEVVGPRDDIQTVKVGGAAVTVLRGELTI
ncbi:MAG: PhzF family phenazine biosynthesis protein [Chloroflexi bacterium]|nr:MAG: PhzF family phenazine biosynthesis protein [Chloroflexota bacterium]